MSRLKEISEEVKKEIKKKGLSAFTSLENELIYKPFLIANTDELVGYIDYFTLQALKQSDLNRLCSFTNLEILNWEDLKRGRRIPLVSNGILKYKTTGNLYKYKFPTRMNLKKGYELPIYTNWKSETGFQGYAKLLQRIEERELYSPYKRNDIKKKEDGSYIDSKKTFNWLYQTWLVEFTEGSMFKRGFRTVRNIGYFHSVDALLPSGFVNDIAYISLDKN